MIFTSLTVRYKGTVRVNNKLEDGSAQSEARRMMCRFGQKLRADLQRRVGGDLLRPPTCSRPLPGAVTTDQWAWCPW